MFVSSVTVVFWLCVEFVVVDADSPLLLDDDEDDEDEVEDEDDVEVSEELHEEFGVNAVVLVELYVL